MISQFNTASPSRKASLTHAKRYVRHLTSLFSRYTSFCCLLFGMLLFFSCGKSSSSDSPAPVVKSTAKVVSSFIFEASENTALDSDVSAVVDATAKTIAVTVPLGTDVTALTPTIVVSDKAIIAPLTGVAQDFTSDVKYIVTAEDKSTQAYTVTVTIALSPAKDVTKFTFETADNTLTDAVVGDITDTAITATVPFGKDVTALKPTIVHTGKSVAPLTGVAQDFTSDVKYIVTAEDKSTQAYTVTVTVAKSTAKVVSSFIFEASENTALDSNVIATVTGTAIAATVPFGTDVKSLKPTIVHTGKSIAPLTGVAQDFTSPATYTVTAADGTKQTYTVTVTAALSPAKAITFFVFTDADNDALAVAVIATITDTAITATVPFGTDVTVLKPTIVHTGKSVAPLTGVAQDFTSPATYTVTAADETKQTYTVTVTAALSPAKAITFFVFTDADNDALAVAVTATITDTAITATVPFGTDVTMLTPTIIYNGLSISPDNEEAQDFTTPVTYTVTAEDGSTREYKIMVRYPSTEKAIKSFTFKASENKGLIEDIAATVNGATVPFGTDVTMLTPTIIYNGLSISPDNEEAQDFTTPVTYTVTAEDGSTREYKIAVRYPSTEKEISSFVFEADENTAVTTDISATISGTDINIVVPEGTDIKSLKPTIVHTGKSVAPLTGVAQDFTSPATYTVTAADGTKQTYTVTVTATLSPAKAITFFVFTDADNDALAVAVIATITDTAITATVPFGTDVTVLKPTIVHTGKSVAPLTGVAQDFTSPATYTVTAADGTKQTYTVTVTAALSPAKAITFFVFTDADNDALAVAVTATITDTTITAMAPFGTDVKSLKPTIVHTGKSIAPLTGVAQDFTSPATYTVTAADGTKQTYTVTVTAALSPAKAITFFVFTDADNDALAVAVIATITDTAITATVPFGTDIKSLKPTIVHTGKSVAPLTGVAQDFTSPATYTVTAADGTKQTYTMTVTAALSPAKAITFFVFTDADNDALAVAVTATITDTAITATVPFGTDVKSLKPTIVHTGKSIAPLTGVAQDFTSPATYTVTAADGTKQTYTVTVTAALSPANEITSFMLIKKGTENSALAIDVTATISDTDINIGVPVGTILTALTPTIVHNGASIAPLIGVVQDFSKLVTYTVTAENGDKKTYTIRVANYATIPDANFRRYLKEKFPAAFGNRETMDTNHTDVIDFEGQIFVFRKDIASLEGIQYFSKLTDLNCGGNDLTSLDVSQNIALISLDCGGDSSNHNDLTELDVRPLTKLRNLYCGLNDLKSLDVSQNTALTDLNCGGDSSNNNDLTELDVRPLTKLIRLDCSYNDLKSLDVSQNIALISLNCGGGYYNNNDLTELDVRPLTKLTRLDCRYNNLKVLNVSQNTTLTDLNCADNDLTSLNVLPLTKLTYLDCGSNDLTSLNVRPLTKLNRLNCSYNKLTSLNVLPLTKLNRLYCGGNDLTSLNVLPLTKLIDLYCGGNDLTSLNVLPLTKLRNLNCRGNDLTSLDVSQQPALRLLRCNFNKLTTLILGQKPKLEVLECESNDLTSLDIREIQSVSVRFFKIDAGEEDNGVTKNPLTMLRVNEMLKNYQEIKDAKTNRGSAITITTYNTDGTVGCTNYDPNTGTCQN